MNRNHQSILLIILLFSFVSSPIFGQGLLERATRRAAERLEQKTEERIDRKVDDAIDRSLDNVESSVERDEPDRDQRSSTSERRAEEREERSQRRFQSMMSNMGVSGEPVPIEDQYRFHSTLRMNMQMYDGDGTLQNDGDFITYVSSNSEYLAYEFISGNTQAIGTVEEGGTIIVDTKNKATIVLTQERGKKTGIAYGSDAMNHFTGMDDSLYDEDDDFETETNPKFRKTGRTKTIHGHRCEEWEFSDDEGKGTFWIAPNFQGDSRHLFGSVFTVSAVAHGQPSGFIMESEYTEHESGERNVMKVTEINDRANVTFNMADYEITNIGSFNMADK
ncbi:hypothetical protein [Alkalitalea saponilacus]|uniref:DUF4412 domain-containing protein n=1 Tax=Alkalitalea saponilacus TaxID=889453 RepID=A0A1T5EP24_9BACT|nr:hypothetical protein [Alkalitalea saponilacus]SKB85721.1 hypothetical protein SAMN03080601_01350 [Alkalitalea saponilacus]